LAVIEYRLTTFRHLPTRQLSGDRHPSGAFTHDRFCVPIPTGTVTGVTAPTRAALSRELIARTALALTDEGGLTSLSMRKLGSELGVEAMSLYHYVDNKDDLLDAMLDCLYAEVELPIDVPGDDWERLMRLGFSSFHDVLVRHPAALGLFATRPAKSEAALSVLMWSYGRLHAVGLDVEEACHAFHFAVSFVMGHVANELGVMALVTDGGGIDLAGVTDAALKTMLECRRTITSEAMFAAGLDMMVAGLRAQYNLP
jgi:AcrR family transcriptional regulator